MKFKTDQNLPLDVANVLRESGFDAISVTEQGLNGAPDAIIAEVCQSESRTLITLDTDFADIRAYPLADYPGIIVLRLQRQDKYHVMRIIRSLVSVIQKNDIENKLWIVDEKKIRVRY